MSRQDDLAHLRDDAPYLVCSSCARHTWDLAQRGGVCGMTQPSGDRCSGTFDRLVVPAEEAWAAGADDAGPVHPDAWLQKPVTSPRPGGYDQAVRSDDPLVVFLYLLMRDELTPGVVEGLACQSEQVDTGNVSAFSNDFLAAYALELRDRLRGVAATTALASAHAALAAAQGRPAAERARLQRVGDDGSSG